MTKELFYAKNEHFILVTLMKKRKPLHFCIEVKTMFKLSYQIQIHSKQSVFCDGSKAQANLNTTVDESIILQINDRSSGCFKKQLLNY